MIFIVFIASFLFSKDSLPASISIATMRCDAAYELCLLRPFFPKYLMHASHLPRGLHDSGVCLGRINNKHKILAGNGVNEEFMALYDKWKKRREKGAVEGPRSMCSVRHPDRSLFECWRICLCFQTSQSIGKRWLFNGKTRMRDNATKGKSHMQVVRPFKPPSSRCWQMIFNLTLHAVALDAHLDNWRMRSKRTQTRFLFLFC